MSPHVTKVNTLPEDLKERIRKAISNHRKMGHSKEEAVEKTLELFQEANPEYVEYAADEIYGEEREAESQGKDEKEPRTRDDLKEPEMMEGRSYITKGEGKCHICGKKFSDVGKFEEHYKKEHGRDTREGEENKEGIDKADYGVALEKWRKSKKRSKASKKGWVNRKEKERLLSMDPVSSNKSDKDERTKGRDKSKGSDASYFPGQDESKNSIDEALKNTEGFEDKVNILLEEVEGLRALKVQKDLLEKKKEEGNLTKKEEKELRAKKDEWERVIERELGKRDAHPDDWQEERDRSVQQESIEEDGFSVETLDSDYLTHNSARLWGKLQVPSNFGSEVEVGFRISEDKSEVKGKGDINVRGLPSPQESSGKFHKEIDGLKMDTKYFYRAMAVYNDGGGRKVLQGKLKSFKTEAEETQVGYDFTSSDEGKDRGESDADGEPEEPDFVEGECPNPKCDHEGRFEKHTEQGEMYYKCPKCNYDWKSGQIIDTIDGEAAGSSFAGGAMPKSGLVTGFGLIVGSMIPLIIFGVSIGFILFWLAGIFFGLERMMR